MRGWLSWLGVWGWISWMHERQLLVGPLQLRPLARLATLMLLILVLLSLPPMRLYCGHWSLRLACCYCLRQARCYCPLS